MQELKGQPPRISSLSQFWRSLIRFGSPRFSAESVIELSKTAAANDDQCCLELDPDDRQEAC